jgi:DNA-binding response OmpR family regulator
MTRVLVVDDDGHIRELVRAWLERDGLEVAQAQDAVQAELAIGANPPDLVILDLMLPGKDGWTVCREIRAASDRPILMLTAKGETRDKVRELGLGADDYLVKPFDPRELVARVRALLKRYRSVTARAVRIGAVCLDRTRYAVLHGDRAVPLPMKEF